MTLFASADGSRSYQEISSDHVRYTPPPPNERDSQKEERDETYFIIRDIVDHKMSIFSFNQVLPRAADKCSGIWKEKV